MDGDGAMKKLLILLVLASGPVMAQLSTTPTHEDYKSVDITVASKVVHCKVSSRDKLWRFVHDGTALKVIPFYGDGETWTKGHIVESTKLDDIKKIIVEKHLTVTKEQQDAIDALEEPK